MTRNTGPEGPGFWQLDGSLFKRFRDRRRPLRRVPHRRLQRDQLGALGQPEHRLQHRDRQHLRPDHRHHRRPAKRAVRRAVRVLKIAVRGSAGSGVRRWGPEATVANSERLVASEYCRLSEHACTSRAAEPATALELPPRAIILARGLGTRMKAADAGVSLTADQHRAADAGLKAMMPIAGRPFLDYVLSAAADAGLTRIAIVVAPDHAELRHHYCSRRAPSARRPSTSWCSPSRAAPLTPCSPRSDWADDDAFLVMNGDNLYPAAALSALARLDEPGLAGFDRRRSGPDRQHPRGPGARVRAGRTGRSRLPDPHHREAVGRRCGDGSERPPGSA